MQPGLNPRFATEGPSEAFPWTRSSAGAPTPQVGVSTQGKASPEFCLHGWVEIGSAVGILFLFWTFLVLVPLAWNSR